jgi:hypothetical protein
MSEKPISGGCLCGRVWFEVTRLTGLLDDDPGLKPDKHIYVEHRAWWHTITDDLPQFTASEIALHRASAAD